MIIGISAKMNSGKDLIGKIIQHLTGFNSHIPFKEWEHSEYDEDFNSSFKIKKFADKLKDIICILINCTREQLEDESFKSKELGEEWWYWYMERDGGYSPIILDYLTTTKKELKNYEGLELIKPTIRFLLQFIGTNLFRDQLHPNIWVNALMSEYKYQYNNQGLNHNDMTDINNYEYPNWIITDMRFPNEVKAVKDRGGITIRVNRDDLAENSHPSETSLDSATFDFVINNDKDIKHLINEVRKILEKLSII